MLSEPLHMPAFKAPEQFQGNSLPIIADFTNGGKTYIRLYLLVYCLVFEFQDIQYKEQKNFQWSQKEC